MLTNKISVLVLEDFISKVRTARRTNSKSITLSINEADDLSYNLNIVLLKLLDKMQEAETISNSDSVITVEMDGGNFE